MIDLRIGDVELVFSCLNSIEFCDAESAYFDALTDAEAAGWTNIVAWDVHPDDVIHWTHTGLCPECSARQPASLAGQMEMF